jgi:hypothetical protein
MAAKDNKPKEKELPNLSYDWNLLGNANVAEEYLKRGKPGIPYTQKSLELILKDANISDPWIINTVTDPEVVRKTVANQLETYNQFKERQTIGDLTKYHADDFTKYLGDNSKYAQEELGAFEKLRYADIERQIEEQEYIIQGGKLGKNSDAEVEEAEKNKEKYGKVIHTFDLLQGLHYGKFRTRVEEGVAVDVLNEMYSPKKESEEGKGKGKGRK